MSRAGWLARSERWSRLLLRLYPAHFREELGEEVVEAYRDRARTALDRGGVPALLALWLRALVDSARNGLGERMRPSIRWRRLGDWGRDSQMVLRRLARAPLFVATMVGTLTVGLGAFAVVYAVVDEVLIEPLPYEKPEDLYFVWRDYTGWFDLNRGALAGIDVTEMDAAGGVIEGAAGMDLARATLGGEGGDEPREVSVVITSPDLFPLLGVQPLHGRLFAESEVGPGRPPVALLAHDLWRDRFGADPAIVGRDVRLNGMPHTVVGVMKPDFRFVEQGSTRSPEVYTTFGIDLAMTNAGAGSYSGVLRARPGASPEAVVAAVAEIGRRIDEREFDGQGMKLYPVGMKADLLAEARPALVALGLAAGLLVLVLAVNLATLLLVRATQREREFAISRALGADRAALIRATVLEGGILGLLSGVGAATLAVWGTRALVAIAPVDLPRRESIGVDLETAATVIAIGTVLGLLAGAVPAVWSTRGSLATLLRVAAVRGGAGSRVRRGMVVAQVALALVLLSTGGLLVRSFEQLLRADPGFDPAGVLTLRIPVPGGDRTDEEVNAIHARIERELAALPGVQSVGAADVLPLTAEADQSNATFPGAPGNRGIAEQDEPLVDYYGTRGDFFGTFGIRLLAGRGFTESPPPGLREAVIDQTLATIYFPGANPVGAIAMLGDDSARIVGVVEHARQHDIHQDGRGQIYLRNENDPEQSLSWALRTERAPLSLVSEARTAVWRVDPQLAVSDIRSMDQVVAASLGQERVSAVMISGFSVGALLLAAMGLYGIVAGSVTRRRQEIAVRIALGAERVQVVGLMLREGMGLVLLGVLVGVPGVWAATRLIESALVGVSRFDPVALGGVAAALSLVALAACWIPARRASSIEPAGLLRGD